MTFQLCFGLVSGTLFIDARFEISTIGVSNSRFSHGKNCKKQHFTETVPYRFRGRCLSFLEAFGTVILVFATLKAGMKIYGFLGCNEPRVGQVPELNHDILEPCKQLNSRWLIAESRTDDC